MMTKIELSKDLDELSGQLSFSIRCDITYLVTDAVTSKYSIFLMQLLPTGLTAGINLQGVMMNTSPSLS